MPLNYSKWDQLQLSDDSDIEGHPNVDKRSLITWMRRDIHEKREKRKGTIARLRAQIACNQVLLPRLRELADRLSPDKTENPQALFNEVAEKLKSHPSPDGPPENPPGGPTYDSMILSLLLQVGNEAKELAKDEGDPGSKLIGLMEKHLEELGRQTSKLEKELDSELKEQKKHITSEDIHEGFENKYVPAKPPPPPVPGALIDKPSKKGKGKMTTTTTTYEVLNPKPSSSSSAAAPDPDPGSGDEGETLPTLTPALQGFSSLPMWDYQASWEFIQQHRDVVVPGAQDALLVAAFKAQSEGNSTYAKKCVHQSKLLAFCESLGPDGVRVFFQRMISGKTPATAVFVKDVEDTYSLLVQRVAISLREEKEASAEQIQLVPEKPDQTISFNVPEGPPPEHLVLEGPGTEDMDIEEVRKALQLRWNVFSGFPENLKEALKAGTLEGVNKVLGKMSLEEAEEVVKLLEMGGILSFAEGGIRDGTGKPALGTDDEDVGDEVVADDTEGTAPSSTP